MIAKKIKVLCVDDSALMRDLLTEIINAQPDMHVVATASDPLIARDLIKRHDPDVLTLDINMPRMDGLVFLTHLMRLRPMPVLMVSSLTRKNSKTSLKALELGAVDVIAKSGLGIRDNRMHDDSLIVDKIRAAAQSKPCRLGAAPRVLGARARGGRARDRPRPRGDARPRLDDRPAHARGGRARVRPRRRGRNRTA